MNYAITTSRTENCTHLRVFKSRLEVGITLVGRTAEITILSQGVRHDFHFPALIAEHIHGIVHNLRLDFSCRRAYSYFVASLQRHWKAYFFVFHISESCL